MAFLQNELDSFLRYETVEKSNTESVLFEAPMDGVFEKEPEPTSNNRRDGVGKDWELFVDEDFTHFDVRPGRGGNQKMKNVPYMKKVRQVVHRYQESNKNHCIEEVVSFIRNNNGRFLVKMNDSVYAVPFDDPSVRARVGQSLRDQKFKLCRTNK